MKIMAAREVGGGVYLPPFPAETTEWQGLSPVEEIGKMKMTDVVESMYGGGRRIVVRSGLRLQTGKVQSRMGLEHPTLKIRYRTNQ